MAKQAAVPSSYDGHYRLSTNDQPQVTLVLYENTKAGVHLRPRYRHLACEACEACEACGALDPHRAFDEGFDDVKVRVKGDLGASDDKVLLVNSRTLDSLRAEEVDGFEAKPIGEGWSAVRVTCLVDSAPGLREPDGDRTPCPGCGRPAGGMRGLFQRLGEVTPPAAPKTLFSPRAARSTAGSRPLDDREVLLTGGAVAALKRAGLKGGVCLKLMTEPEWKILLADHKKGGASKYPEAVFLK